MTCYFCIPVDKICVMYIILLYATHSQVTPFLTVVSVRPVEPQLSHPLC